MPYSPSVLAHEWVHEVRRERAVCAALLMLYPAETRRFVSNIFDNEILIIVRFPDEWRRDRLSPPASHGIH
jgi:hypothetical protein